MLFFFQFRFGFSFQNIGKLGEGSVSVFQISENLVSVTVAVSQKRPVNQVFGFGSDTRSFPKDPDGDVRLRYNATSQAALTFTA